MSSIVVFILCCFAVSCNASGNKYHSNPPSGTPCFPPPGYLARSCRTLDLVDISSTVLPATEYGYEIMHFTLNSCTLYTMYVNTYMHAHDCKS